MLVLVVAMRAKNGHSVPLAEAEFHIMNGTVKEDHNVMVFSIQGNKMNDLLLNGKFFPRHSFNV